jgi:hypothetical protein
MLGRVARDSQAAIDLRLTSAETAYVLTDSPLFSNPRDAWNPLFSTGCRIFAGPARSINSLPENGNFPGLSREILLAAPASQLVSSVAVR